MQCQDNKIVICLMKVRLSYIIPGMLFVFTIFTLPIYTGFDLDRSAYYNQFGNYIFIILGICIFLTAKYYSQYFIYRKCFVRLSARGLHVGRNIAISFKDSTVDLNVKIYGNDIIFKNNDKIFILDKKRFDFKRSDLMEKVGKFNKLYADSGLP